MAHDPCGTDIPGGDARRCWSHGRCEKRFPRVQVDQTDPNVEGYPYYRRRLYLNDKSKYEMPGKFKMLNGKKIRITNPFMPAYNPVMLLRYRYHINVECSEGMSCMHYLFGYINKGHDVAHVQFKEFKETENEIKLHKYGRVITADEAHWNIIGFKNSEIKPIVKRLPFFVPGDKYVRVKKNQVPKKEDIERQRRETEFYSYFERNKLEYEIRDKYNKMVEDEEDPKEIVKFVNDELGYEMFYVNAKGDIQRWFDWEYPETPSKKRQREEEKKPEPVLPWAFELSYIQFATRYNFKSKKVGWKRYKRFGSPRYARMYLSYPGNDFFYLRILLKNRIGVRSIEELYHGPDGKKYPNFKLTCLAWEYINNSTEYFIAMFEAHQMGWKGQRLLKFYASIIAEGDVTNIREIWEGVDPNKEKRTDEEKLFPKGFKDHMIYVPKTLRDEGYGPDYKLLPDDERKLCVGLALKSLAFYLEQLGKDYPEELPELSDQNVDELGREWRNAHKVDPEEAKRTYDFNKGSKLDSLICL